MKKASEAERNEVLTEITTAIRNLMGYIEIRLNNLPEGHRLYIVALARKMPRLLQRIFREFTPEERVKFENILSQCILTTEHAIPFIFKDINPADVQVLVLDDALVSGNTLRSVLSNLHLLTGKNSDLVTLYYYRSAIRPKYINTWMVGTTGPISIDKVREKLQIISSLIAESELPVDLEFPILHLNVKDKTGIKVFEENLQGNFGRYIKYRLPDTAIINFNPDHRPLQSLNILLYSALSDTLRSDFAKIRCFEDPITKEIKIVPFAPMSIRCHELESRDLFEAPGYSEIWQNIYDNIYNYHRDTIESDTSLNIQNRTYENTILRSKAIIANWLYSLSIFIATFYDKDTRKYKGLDNELPIVNARDLKWIIGKKLATETAETAQRILSNGSVEVSYHYEAPIPALLSSPNKEQAFVSNLIQRLNTSENLYDGLRKTFALANSMRISEIRNLGIADDKKANSMLPRGLKFFLQFNYAGSNLEAGILKWLDAAIDLGIVVPKYKLVADEEFITYVARYYFASHFAE